MPNATDLLQFGPFVALVFALAYGAYVLIPKAFSIHEAAITRMTADHKAAVEKMAADHKSTVDKLVGEFRAEIKDQRDWHEVELAKRDATINKIAEAVDRIGEKVNK